MRSRNGVALRLTDERWRHITTGHPEMAEEKERVLETAADPDAIQEGDGGELLAIRLYEKTPLTRKHLVVPYNKRSRRMQRCVALLLLSVILACGGDSREIAPSSESAISGSVTGWSVSHDPLLVIGEDDTRPGHALRAVDGATRLSDGRIVIADGSSEIRFFSEDGNLITTAGGSGEGPGEVSRGIASFARGAGDTVIVWSGDLSLSVVAPEGEIVAKTRVGWLPLRFECHMPQPRDVILAPDRTLIVQAGEAGRQGCSPERPSDGRYRTTDLLMRYDPGTSELDTLAALPGTERDKGGYAAFGRALTVAVSSNRIFAGDTGGDSIAVFSLGGERQGTWTVPLEARRITVTPPMPDVEPQRLRTGQVLPGGELSLDVDSVYPRFARILSDHEGHLWVMAYPELEEVVDAFRLKSLNMWIVDPKGAEWTVLNARGETVASLRTPPDVYVLEIGDSYLLGLHRGQLDVESVRLYRLTRPQRVDES